MTKNRLSLIYLVPRIGRLYFLNKLYFYAKYVKNRPSKAKGTTSGCKDAKKQAKRNLQIILA